MSMRKLATVRIIKSIEPIKDADSIVKATVDGWGVVVKKGEFSVGDRVIYLEIDSWVPHDLAPFLTKGDTAKEYQGVKGNRLRTVRLRGCLSQGLILPLTFESEEGEDLTEKLGVTLYEKPVPAHLAGLAKGHFPSFIPKTDQERVQNLVSEIEKKSRDLYEVTEKLDGSSMTVYFMNGVFGVCSRNLELKEDENNTFWKTANQYDLKPKMVGYGLDGYAIQGELTGNGIQGNPYNLIGHKFYVFDVYAIGKGEYLLPEAREKFTKGLGLDHVPVIGHLAAPSVEYALDLAKGKSRLNPNAEREGLVFKSLTERFSFKAISNDFLLKQKE